MLRKVIVLSAFFALVAYDFFLKTCLKVSGVLDFVGMSDKALAIQKWVESRAEEVVKEMEDNE